MFPAIECEMIQTGGRGFLVFLLTVAAAVCLVFGLTLPVVKLTRLYFWTDTHSLLSIILALYYDGELFLAGIILTFSVIFPVFKLLYIVACGTLFTDHSLRRRRWLKRIEWLGKWSMLDVLVLALLIFYAKSTSLADATALPGIYYFAASVVLTMIAYGLIGHHGSQSEAQPDPHGP
jgi:paraquat-inducible protein A